MAKGAATETALGALHAKMADVFQKVLERYEARLDAVESIDPEEFESEVLTELFHENAMPNPAMLSAISKFLKDNEISMDTEKLDELSSTQRRLQERREKRASITDLSTLRVVGDG